MKQRQEVRGSGRKQKKQKKTHKKSASRAERLAWPWVFNNIKGFLLPPPVQSAALLKAVETHLVPPSPGSSLRQRRHRAGAVAGMSSRSCFPARRKRPFKRSHSSPRVQFPAIGQSTDQGKLMGVSLSVSLRPRFNFRGWTWSL